MVGRRVIKIGLSASALVDVVHGVAVPFILCRAWGPEVRMMAHLCLV